MIINPVKEQFLTAEIDDRNGTSTIELPSKFPKKIIGLILDFMYRGECYLPPQNSKEYRILLTALGYFEIEEFDLDQESSITEYESFDESDDDIRIGLILSFFPTSKNIMMKDKK